MEVPPREPAPALGGPEPELSYARLRPWWAPQRHDGIEVRLGAVAPNGLAPAVAAIIERGVLRRPQRARELCAVVELTVRGAYPPVRIAFRERHILVEDGPARAPDLRVEGELTDLISLLVAPTLGGLPNPVNPLGRAALGKVASRRVKVRGRVALMRRLLGLVKI